MTSPKLEPSLKVAGRRTRTRRAVAFAGMLVALSSLVGIRAVTMPAAPPALSGSHLAAPSGSQPSGGSAPPGPPAPSNSAGKRVLVGQPYDVGYGVVQVKVTMVGSRIADVTPLSLPQGGRSSDISQYAAPALRREAIAAQSAQIDSVSGASYTSAGYAQSLQSALDQMGR